MGKYAFRVGAARHRKSLVKTIPWQTGQRVSIGLDNIGYLAELQILFALTVTIGTAGTVTDAAAGLNFAPFIGLRSPQGEQVVSTNSRDLFDFNYRLEKGMVPSNDPSYAAVNYNSATAQPVNLRLRLPVSLNDGESFDFGMLMRQISNNQFFLDIQMAQQSDLVGSGSSVVSSITGNIYIEEVYYDAVTDGGDVNPPSFAQILRLRSITNIGNLVNGQNDVRYDTGPIMVDAFHRLINNGAADGTVSNLSYIQLVANKGNEIDNRTGNRIAYDNQQHLGKAMRAGVYHEDFCDDVGDVNQTKARDFINSNMAAQLDFMVQYAGTPSGTSQVQSLYREIVTLSA